MTNMDLRNLGDTPIFKISVIMTLRRGGVRAMTLILAWTSNHPF